MNWQVAQQTPAAGMKPRTRTQAEQCRHEMAVNTKAMKAVLAEAKIMAIATAKMGMT